MKELLLLATGLLAQDGAASDWKEALRQERFAQAWQAIDGEADALARHRAEVEILMAAGDPAGALAFAEDALVAAPGDLELLFRAAASAIWLRAGGWARDAFERLAAALSQAELSGDDRAAWERALEDQRARIEALERSESERERGLSTARFVALAVLAASVLGLAVMLAAPGGVRPQRG